MSSIYPYADRYPVNSVMPETGRDRAEILAELGDLAQSEDSVWETGQCSGTMYCGDHDHYAFMAKAFEDFAHVNALQRDMCPSTTRFEGEIIAMTLDMLNASAIEDSEPVGMVTSGGSGSILHAVLAYRDQGRANGIDRPNIVKPETGHPAFDKAGYLLGVEIRKAPIDPDTTKADLAGVAELIDDNTVALIGSATNYGYGTIDPITELGELALERGVGLHVDGCLGGFILPWGEALGDGFPRRDFRVPGLTT
ncbi:MAG: aspartate aminotransferase family protein, partial [Actinobacteria bacterium]